MEGGAAFLESFREQRQEGKLEVLFLPVNRSEDGFLLIYYFFSEAILDNQYAAEEVLIVFIHPGCGMWANLKALL